MIVLFELMLISWTQRFPPQPLIAIGYLLVGIGFGLTGLAKTIPALAATVVVWTIGEMTFAPVTGAFVTSRAPERYRGRYMGLWILMWSIGMLLGPSVGTLLYQYNRALLWSACAVAGTVAAGLSIAKFGPRHLTAGQQPSAHTSETHSPATERRGAS